MLKKIILGIVITAVLSVTAFGVVYAYQKEEARSGSAVTGENTSLRYGSDPGEDCEGWGDKENEDCLREEERIRNNLRYRETREQDCFELEGEEHRWQHRYENENIKAQEEYGDCGESPQYKNQNGGNGKKGKF